MKRLEKKLDFLTNLFIIVVLLAVIVPFIFYGENSFITIHDNLDITASFYKLFKDNNLFFKFDSPAPALNGMSTIYFITSSFSIQALLNAIFSTFTAYLLSFIFSLIIGFFSMNGLLNYIFKGEGKKNIYKLISLSFCILPAVSDWYFGMATLPLIIYIFLRLLNIKDNSFNKKVSLLVLFPIMSNFTAQGIFVLGLWFVGLIYYSLKRRSINKSLLFGFLFLVIGYILVNLRLFYSMFVVKETLNRSIFNIPPGNLIESFISYLIKGFYHGSTLQYKIILPTIILGVPLLNFKYKRADFTRIINFSAILIILFSFIAALYDSKVLTEFIKAVIPPLDGFNWGRIVYFNRVLWYVIFCGILVGIHKYSKIKYLSYILAIMQICYIIISPVEYNDSVKNIFHNHFAEKGNITYSEFYSENLFSKIKKDINYNGEAVIAFGYHPAVLTYNGFNTIDGYMNSYPLTYMKKFRELIAPELEINEKDRAYYDMWGGRLYVYSSEMSYEPTRSKVTNSVNLNINMNIFAELKGKYILSRGKIRNSDELGIKLLNTYDDENGIYTIYVYER